MKKQKYDIFISYRRNGGDATARILRDRLDAHGYRVFYDVESLRSGDFNVELYSVIDECTDFLIVLSPGALDRCDSEDDWVRRELERALEKKKNVVPILLRNFTFPETLPPSIEAVRNMNGMESNTQLFDAFVETLEQKFLHAKPTLFRRLAQNPLVRKTIPALLALLLTAAIAAGVFLAVRAGNRTFPGTAREWSVTSEVVYYAESNLQRLDLMADGFGDAVSAARRYLNAGSKDTAALRDAFELARSALNATDLDACAPDDGMIARVGELRGTPFSTAEIIGMHSFLENCRDSWLEQLDYLEETATSEKSMQSTDTRLRILDAYEVIFAEDLKASAYAANELLLPITRKSALDEFFNKFLPMLKRVPLTAAGWSSDAAALKSAQDACYNRQLEASDDLATLVGNAQAQSEAMAEALIQTYMSVGMTREEAERVVAQVVDAAPRPGDDEETLWEKMSTAIVAMDSEGALACVDALEALVGETDSYAADYIPALRRFAEEMPETNINFGVMVVGWGDPATPNEQYRIGDIVIGFDDELCHSYEEYLAEKGALDADDFVITVLRPDESGQLELVPLMMDTSMPLVRLRSLNRAYDYAAVN